MAIKTGHFNPAFEKSRPKGDIGDDCLLTMDGASSNVKLRQAEGFEGLGDNIFGGMLQPCS